MAASNLGLFIADQILFGMGFSGLLFSTYSLQNDRERIANTRYKRPLILLVTNRRFYHLVIVAAIVLIIIGTNMLTSGNSNRIDVGNNLRIAGTCMLLIMTVVQGLRSGAFVYIEFMRYHNTTRLAKNSLSDRNASWFLLLISALLLWRMIYSVITIRQKVQNETLYFLLSAFPEFLCTCVLGIPGLVLSRVELQERDVELKEYQGRITSTIA